MARSSSRASQTRRRRDRLFVEHPRSLGMSWAEHGVGAVAIGARAGRRRLRRLVHAVVPGWFTADRRQDGHATCTTICQQRKAGAANPENWPDYEI